MITDEIPFPPATWTPDWVMYLMVLSAGIFGRMRERVGPGGYKVAWPQTTYSWEDQLGWETENVDGSKEGDNRRSVADVVIYVPPDPDEVELASAVSIWPARYLGAVDGQIVAITRWASKRADGHEGDLGIALIEAEARKICRGLGIDRVPVMDVPFRLRDIRNRTDAEFIDETFGW